jgi:hypothetical protein
MERGREAKAEVKAKVEAEADGWRLEVGGPGLEGRIDACVPGYIFPFEKLEVWNDSVALADLILGLLDRVPQGRYIRLVSQLEGAAVSVSQNIAEGKGRQHRKEFLQYEYRPRLPVRNRHAERSIPHSKDIFR